MWLLNNYFHLNFEEKNQKRFYNLRDYIFASNTAHDCNIIKTYRDGMHNYRSIAQKTLKFAHMTNCSE